MFNNFGLHTPPLALSIIDSIILQTLLNRSNIAIEVINHPLPPNVFDKLAYQQSQNGNGPPSGGSIISFAIIIAMSMVVSSYVNFLIRERENKSKHMQVLC